MFSLRLFGRVVAQKQLGISSAVLLRQLTSECSAKNDRPFFLNCKGEYTSDLSFINPDKTPAIPIYRVLDLAGKLVSKEPKIDREMLVKMYKYMVKMNVMDKVMTEAKNQGRIEFLITSLGEEALMTASSAGLKHADPIWWQYRESGVLLWRGFSVDKMLAQLQCTVEDYTKGRNMAMFYGSRECNVQIISAPLTTQLPHAVGNAYRVKLENREVKNKEDQRIVAVYFGEGAASEGDFHAAMNFASTLGCPVLFLCRNNGYAISTHVNDQYRGDGVAARAPAYGMMTARVDGNDALAVYSSVSQARDIILKEGRPVLLELMSYRVSHHTCSENSLMYRSKEELEMYDTVYSPIPRYKNYLIQRQLWSPEEDAAWVETVKQEVEEAISRSLSMKKAHLLNMFSDVYYDGPDGSETPKHIREQAEKFRQFIARNGHRYPLHKYAPMPLSK